MIEMHVYGAEGFPDYPYNRSKDYTFLKNGDDIDVIILKLMYILATDTEPEKLDFNINYLKTIPHLKKCKMLREENDKIKPNIPILNKPDFFEFWKLLNETEEKFSCNEELTLKTIEFLKNKKTKIPNHLTSVPEQKQYQYATSAFLFATIREAIAHGELYDGNYDDDSGETVNQHPCPMVLMID